MTRHARRTFCPIVAGLTASFVLTFSANAAVYTQVESATEPDYENFRLSTIVIDVHAVDSDTRQSIGERIAKSLKKHGVTVYLQSDLFPAPEEWSADIQEQLYESLSIDALMLVDVGGKNAKASFQVDAGNYSARSLPGVGPAPPVRMSERDRVNVSDSSAGNLNVERKVTTEFHVLVIDAANDNKVWSSELKTHARGLSLHNDDSLKSAAKALVRRLAEDELVAKD